MAELKFVDVLRPQVEHQERAEQEMINGRKRKAEDTQSFFSWFWQSGEIPEGSDPISDLIKDELWANPLISRDIFQASAICIILSAQFKHICAVLVGPGRP